MESSLRHIFKEYIFTLRIALICFAVQGGSMIFVVASESLKSNKVIKETHYGFIRKRHRFIDVEIRKRVLPIKNDSLIRSKLAR